jgi:hypothetical protein
LFSSLMLLGSSVLVLLKISWIRFFSKITHFRK